MGQEQTASSAAPADRPAPGSNNNPSPVGEGIGGSSPLAGSTRQSPDEFYWEWGLHEDHMYTNRINYSLVAEAMLFAAMAQLRASSEPKAAAALPVVYGLGVFVTAVWLAVNHRHLQHTDKLVTAKIKEHVRLWREVDDQRPKPLWRIRTLTGYLLPIGMLITWLVLWILV